MVGEVASDGTRDWRVVRGLPAARLDGCDIEDGSAWVDLYRDEREHLRRVCDSAIRAGVEEYHIHLHEQAAQELVERIRRVLVDLGLDPNNEQVRSVVRSRLIEGAR